MTDTAQPEPNEEQRAVDLSEIRVGIDSVDDQIHALLMRRAEFVEQVAATKRLPDGTLPKGAYRPAREASIMRRLYANTRKPLPFSIVFTCWREIIGGFTAMQNPVSVSVQGSLQDNDDDLLDVSRNHFGAAAQIITRDAFSIVASDIQQDPSTIGVASARFDDGWWTTCNSHDDQALHVIAALPFYGKAVTGYCVSRTPLEESGDDETLLAVQHDTAPSHSDIASALESASLEATPLHTSGNTVLIRVTGFHIEADSLMHQSVAKALDVHAFRISVVGAYPTPIRDLSDEEEKA